MSGIRCFAQPRDPSVGSTVNLDEAESRHLSLVRRGRRGDFVTLFDGTGNEFSCEILSRSVTQVSLEIVAHHRRQLPPFQLTLAQALIKGRSMDLVVQKTTEIGITRLIPVASTHIGGALSKTRMARRRLKWHRLSIEACKQCGQPFLPKIDALTPIEVLCQTVRHYHLKIITSLTDDSVTLETHLQKVCSLAPKTTPFRAICLVGPEGDFTSEEYTMARKLGFQPLTLGRNILRAETAAIVAIGILNHELERLFLTSRSADSEKIRT